MSQLTEALTAQTVLSAWEAYRDSVVIAMPDVTAERLQTMYESFVAGFVGMLSIAKASHKGHTKAESYDLFQRLNHEARAMADAIVDRYRQQGL